LLGCHVAKAPSEQDSLLHYLWQNYDADDQTWVAAVAAVHTTLGADKLRTGGDVSGRISGLSVEEIDRVAYDARPDPARARGFFFFRKVACPLGHIERAFYAANQNELYPGTYDAYQRTFSTGLEAYVSGVSNRLAWASSIDATILSSSYHEDTVGEMRRVI